MGGISDLPATQKWNTRLLSVDFYFLKSYMEGLLRSGPRAGANTEMNQAVVVLGLEKQMNC